MRALPAPRRHIRRRYEKSGLACAKLCAQYQLPGMLSQIIEAPSLAAAEQLLVEQVWHNGLDAARARHLPPPVEPA